MHIHIHIFVYSGAEGKRHNHAFTILLIYLSKGLTVHGYSCQLAHCPSFCTRITLIAYDTLITVTGYACQFVKKAHTVLHSAPG